LVGHDFDDRDKLPGLEVGRRKNVSQRDGLCHYRLRLDLGFTKMPDLRACLRTSFTMNAAERFWALLWAVIGTELSASIRICMGGMFWESLLVQHGEPWGKPIQSAWGMATGRLGACDMKRMIFS
jgi:hypothetical protein